MSQAAFRLSPPGSGALAPVASARDVTGVSGGTVAAHSQATETDFRGLLAILRRNVRSIVALTLATVGLALAYVTLATPIYSATATLVIDPRSRKLVGDDVVQGGLGSDLVLVESQVPIITSDIVLRRAAQKLAEKPETDFRPQPSNAGTVERIKEIIRGPRAVQDPEAAAIADLVRSTIVKRAQKTYVVDIEVSSSSPVKAAAAANAIAAAYLADQTNAKAQEAERANKLIDARLGELTEQVRRAEIRIDEFKKANRIVSSEGGILSEQQLGKLSAELASARAVAAEAKARADETKSALSGKLAVESLPEAMKSQLIQRLREQYAQVARREAALRSQLQPKHPVLIEVRSQLAEINQQIKDELARVSKGSASEYTVAAARETELMRIIEQAKDDVARTNTAQIRLREIEREADASRELLRAFLQRAKETSEQINTSTPEARIITQASEPMRPSKPGKVLILSLALLGGLGLGVARALAADHLDQSVRSGSAVDQTVSMPTLMELPLVSARSLVQRLRDQTDGTSARRMEAAGFSDLMAAVGNREALNPRYRQAVVRLLARLRAGVEPGDPLTLLVGGAHRGAGTSSTALALGYTAALAGDRVLLVDACSTDAGLSQVFAKSFGQSETLVLDRKDHLKQITSQDLNSGLSFLPIALTDLRQLRPEQRRRLAAGVAAVSTEYDLVVIDGGALADDDTALSLLPAIDRIVVVARAGETTRDELRAVEDVLDPAHDRVAGIVLNGV